MPDDQPEKVTQKITITLEFDGKQENMIMDFDPPIANREEFKNFSIPKQSLQLAAAKIGQVLTKAAENTKPQGEKA